MATGAGAAAENAAQYAAAAKAYADAADGAAAGISALKGEVSALAAATAAATAALAALANAPRGGGGGGPGGGGGGGPGTPRTSPEEKAAKDDARATEYVYQIKQRYLRQQAKDEAKAADERRRGAYAKRDDGMSSVNAGLAAFKRQQDAAKSAGKGGIGAAGFGGPASEVGQPGVNKDLRYLLKQAGISKAAMRAPVVAAAFDASKLALGIRGMAQLDAVGQRAHQNLRLLFKGIDPSPVVNAFDKLQSTALNPAGATGKALQGIFKRTFTSIFGDVDKLATLGASAFQGLVIGALYAEGAWLDARIALFPLTSAIEGLIGPTDQMKIAAYGGAAALGVMAIAATGAAAPFIAAAAAVTLAYTQFKKLQAEMGASGAQAVDRRDKASSLGEGTDAAAAVYGARRTSDEDFAAMVAAEKAAKESAGAATGKAYADGLGKGIAAGTPGVAGAAGALANVIDPKVRAVTDTHSPSRIAYRTGEEQPAGLAGGIRAGIPDVSRAAGDMGAASNAGGRGGAASGQGAAPAASGVVQVTVVHQWPAGMKRTDDVEGRAESGTIAGIRSVFAQLGLNPRLVT